jgi:hypothetical protein
MRLDRRYLLVLPLLAVLLRADVSLPRVLGDNMVLQREQPVPVWGRAAPGEEVAVRFAGQEKRVRADAAGHWQVTLDALAASATPATLTVAGANTIELKNILVGEVWLCSGQSNMEYAFGTTKPWAGGGDRRPIRNSPPTCKPSPSFRRSGCSGSRRSSRRPRWSRTAGRWPAARRETSFRRWDTGSAANWPASSACPSA